MIARGRSSPVVVRPDPVKNAVPGQEVIYETIQRIWSAVARHRYRAAFEGVRAFVLFAGYPRSGHSLVGAMLNAHRHTVISHELNVSKLFLAGCDRNVVYSRILARAGWFNLKGNRSNYEYQIPQQWQGRFEAIHVIGDKGGGWVAEALGNHPDLLKKIRDTVRVPLRFIHVVRNPFDNIAAISKWHHFSIDESIEYYFSLCQTTSWLLEALDSFEIITVHHEDFIHAPEATLSAICNFLNLQVDPEYLAACASITFEKPTNSRRSVTWNAAQMERIEQQRQSYAFLRGYDFV